ncbi:hypothetical protein IB685_03690 [Francisella tularensis subsp. novicida FSC159]|uniref:DUF6088 family protein n=1 Tax=Francisella tularensis TaxID=263 RepID=UPI001C0EB9AB|nr:DUF6088 family protein [Francisella tularensis]MBK2111279.1 hypothetical protein [Francisella tularensis subsp. novicida FSC159]
MQSIEQKILSKIYRNGRGYSFSSNDFIKDYPRESIDWSLSNLTRRGIIRRIARGLYDYPRYSELLKQNLSPDVEKVAHAIARKFNWDIEVSGDTALNLLGLSTQVVGKYIYLTNGANRSYKILDNITIEFKKSALKNIGFKHRESVLLVQALKSLGKEHIDDEIISKLQNTIDKSMCDKILKDTKTATNWIYEIIKKVCVKGCENEK